MRERMIWARTAVGAAIGLLVGVYVPPGTGAWVFVGAVAGYAAEQWVRRTCRRREPQLTMRRE